MDVVENNEELPIDWKTLALLYPRFVEWIVQNHGGVPEGLVKQSDYERYSSEFETFWDGGG